MRTGPSYQGGKEASIFRCLASLLEQHFRRRKRAPTCGSKTGLKTGGKSTSSAPSVKYSVAGGKARNVAAVASPIILVMCDHLSLPNKLIIPRSTSFLWGWGQTGNRWTNSVACSRLSRVEKLFEVTEYLARCYRNRRTGEVIVASLPGEVAKAGLMETRLSALIGYAKIACHMSYSCIERFLHDVLHLKLSRGYLVKVVQKMSVALAAGHEELRHALPQQPMLNVDGTGHPENGKQFNVWDFYAPAPRASPSFTSTQAGAHILKQFLGETFSGVVGCDYAGEYRRFTAETDARLQFCWCI